MKRIMEIKTELIQFLQKENPYPADIFIKKGKEARIGYNACMKKIEEFFKAEFGMK